MYRLRSFVIRILNVFRSRLEADLSEQLQAHRQMIKADLISRGMDTSEADIATALLIFSWSLRLLAYTVAERKAEIGVRIALGAQTAQVLRLILSQGVALVLAGASVGLIAAFAASRLLRGLLFNVTPYDPMTFAGVTLLLALVCFVAVFIPARRATRVSPTIVLREQ